MCLYVDNDFKTAKKAEKDIICYKALLEISEGIYVTPCQGDVVDISKVQEAEGKTEVTTDYWGDFSIGCGYIHTFADAVDAESLSDKCVVFKCVIPKGTEYYKGKDGQNDIGYASKKLKYIDIKYTGREKVLYATPLEAFMCFCLRVPSYAVDIVKPVFEEKLKDIDFVKEFKDVHDACAFDYFKRRGLINGKCHAFQWLALFDFMYAGKSEGYIKENNVTLDGFKKLLKSVTWEEIGFPQRFTNEASKHKSPYSYISREVSERMGDYFKLECFLSGKNSKGTVLSEFYAALERKTGVKFVYEQ